MTADPPARPSRAPLLLLAAGAYLPLLLTAPGRVGADTKTYLYLDPARLLSRAWSMWDPSIGLGTVSHQNIGYLWPMGPWYWAADRLGLPDWVAQRLWLATILFAAGAGVLWLLRTVLGWRTPAAAVAAFGYAFTPYVLTLAARLSAILLPFAGLPWLLGLTILALRRGGWRHPALFALVVATVGSVNATALALVGLAPVWWLVHARLTGSATTRAVVATTARIGALTLAANLWWVAGLWAQGGWGIDILRYTETAEVVASASNAAEVLRGLGYWFFYGGDRLGPWIEPGAQYTQRLPLLALTLAIPLAALLAGSVVRFRHRSYFAGLIAIGTLAAVGGHPWDDPPLAGDGIKSFLTSDLGLAMRSLPRAAPLVALGLSACLGAGAEAAAVALAARGRGHVDRRRLAAAVPVVAALVPYLALPPLWTGEMVATNLDRPSELPRYWEDVADHLDERGDGTRVLEVPGADFASYRWGNTVDPITPGLVDRPYAARELIPYGTPASADLLSALDRRLQESTLEPGTLAAVSRLLAVGDVVLRGDLQHERFRTPRPYVVSPLLAAEPGLGDPARFGEPAPDRPAPQVPVVDELALARDDRRPRPPVEVFPVEDPEPIVRADPAGGGIVLAGDGEGLVDAAAAGLVDGRELVRYGASLGADGVAGAVEDGAELVITDGNRRQGRRWSTVRDVLGAVEPPADLTSDLSDNRLPVFPDAEAGWETTAAEGSLTVAATSYGNRTSFTPEYRPAYAADGDLATEWRTGASTDVRGERLVLRPEGGSAATELRVVQQLTGARNRHITAVDLRLDGGPPTRIALDDRSLTAAGQVVGVPPAEGDRFDELAIEIVADSTGLRPGWGRPVRFIGQSQVGFAEVELLDPAAGGGAGGAGPATDPALVLPPAATGAITPDSDVALVLTRWRTEPTDYVRADPEVALARQWDQPVARDFLLSGTARLSPRAADRLLDDALAITGPEVEASSRLTGVPAARASAALDGDPATWWSPAYGDAEPALTVTAPAPVTIDRLAPVAVVDTRRSVPARLRVEVDGAVAATVELAGGGEPVVLPAPITGTRFRFVLEAIEARTTIEWFSGQEVVVPPAIAELGIPALATTTPSTVGTDCRSDLLTFDGTAVPVRLAGDVDAALAGGPLVVEACAASVAAAAGEHRLESQAGSSTGIDIDQVVLRSRPSDGASRAGEAPAVSVVDDDRWRLRVAVDGATPGEPFWLVLGQSHSPGWHLDGAEAELVDGYANGWLVTPESASFTVELAWEPQRTVNRALALGAVGVVACTAIAAWGAMAARRRGPRGAPTDHADPAPVVAARPDQPDRWQGPALVVAAGAGALVAIGPVAAVVVAGAAAAGVWAPRARPWLRLGPAAAYAAAAAYILARQAVAQPGPAFEWPAELETAHQPALVAVALLLVVVALDARRDDP